MTRQAILNELEELMELDGGTLSADTELGGLEEWDSMMVLGFIAFADEKLGVVVPAQQVLDAKTPADLMALLGDNVED